MPTKKCKPGTNLIEVCWSDSRSEEGWSEQVGLGMRVAHITTVGHLVKETAKVLCIASSVDKITKQVLGIIYIPKSCILSRTALRQVKGT